MDNANFQSLTLPIMAPRFNANFHIYIYIYPNSNINSSSISETKQEANLSSHTRACIN